MKVRDIMTSNVVYAELPGNRAEVMELLIKHNISGVPVVKRSTKELIGIVTRNDLARKPEEEQLALLMTKDVKTISPEEDIKKAVEIFSQGKFRRLPVVENGKLVGIVTVSDVVWKYIANIGLEEPVEKYMREKIATIWEGTPLNVAYEIMRLSGERALPVLNDEGKLSGIIGDTDLLAVLQVTENTVKSELSGGTEGDRWGWDSKNIVYITRRSLEFPDKTVGDVMVKKVITVTRKTTVSETAKKMAKNRIEQIPVINAEGDIIGLVRDTDLIRAVME